MTQEKKAACKKVDVSTKAHVGIDRKDQAHSTENADSVMHAMHGKSPHAVTSLAQQAYET